mmetsp:Transcript_28299/g.75066  ORF Transcript_28299/g.75066 Transcript_28299/m.75066 type:complete len:236 (-) Transcript_28299:395-1102(-)
MKCRDAKRVRCPTCAKPSAKKWSKMRFRLLLSTMSLKSKLRIEFSFPRPSWIHLSSDKPSPCVLNKRFSTAFHESFRLVLSMDISTLMRWDFDLAAKLSQSSKHNKLTTFRNLPRTLLNKSLEICSSNSLRTCFSHSVSASSTDCSASRNFPLRLPSSKHFRKCRMALRTISLPSKSSLLCRAPQGSLMPRTAPPEAITTTRNKQAVNGVAKPEVSTREMSVEMTSRLKSPERTM